MRLISQVNELVNSAIAGHGYELVQVLIHQNILRVLIEKKDRSSISVNDCESVSKIVSLRLEVEDLMKDNFVLEVSSPGLDRPLTKIEDYTRFTGEEVKMILRNSQEGIKKIKATIKSVVDEKVVLFDSVNDKELSVDFDNISTCRIVPNISFSKNK